MKCAGERRRGIRGGDVGSWALVGRRSWTRQSRFQIIKNVPATMDEEQDSALREQHAFSGELPQCRRGLDHSAAQVLVPEDCWGGGRGAGWRGVLESFMLCASTRFSFWCLRVSCSETRNVLYFDGSGELQNLQKYTLCICLILASYALCISARFVFWLNEVQ